MQMAVNDVIARLLPEGTDRKQLLLAAGATTAVLGGGLLLRRALR